MEQQKTCKNGHKLVGSNVFYKKVRVWRGGELRHYNYARCRECQNNYLQKSYEKKVAKDEAELERLAVLNEQFKKRLMAKPPVPAKTDGYCRNGHPRTPENTRYKNKKLYRKDGTSYEKLERICVKCAYNNTQRWMQKKKLEVS